jgi:hypothetical protein
MNIYPRRNLNLHTAKVPGGLVFCPAGVVTQAPDDVSDASLNPLFKALVDSGDISTVSDVKDKVVLPGGPPGPTGSPLHSPDDETDTGDDLGPAVPAEEAAKVTKPTTAPAAKPVATR